MKRTTLFTCLILILLVLSGCASTAATPATEANTAPVTTEQPTALLNAMLEAPITTAAPETTARPSVLNIPGATVFENDGRFQRYSARVCGGGYDRETQERRARTWLEQVKENNTVIMGKVTDYTSALVPDSDGYYVVTTMEIKVIQDISGVGKDTVHAVYACRYKPHYNYYIPEATYDMNGSKHQADMFDDYQTHTRLYSDDLSVGIFILNEAEGKEVTIENNVYKLSDYSDTVMEACLLYRIGSGVAHLPGVSFTNVYYHLIEEVFNLEKPKPNYEVVDIMEYQDSFLTTEGKPFVLKNTDFAPTFPENSIDLLFYLKKDSPLYDAIIDESYLLGFKTGIHWSITVNDVSYAGYASIGNYLDTVEITLNLGKNFSWSLLASDENGQYTCDDIRLNFYDNKNLILYSADLKDHVLYAPYHCEKSE